jgi:histidinol-phosphate aminotransferase
MKIIVNRRNYLTTNGLALSGLFLPAAPGHTVGTMEPHRVRLSLNENPFGPSRLALSAMQGEFGHLCRYADEKTDVLTPEIVARERVESFN